VAAELTAERRSALYGRALLLARITVLYNLVEGVVSVLLGAGDETLSLMGFGLDSFVEVVSGLGIWHMIRRQMRSPESPPDPFERRALRITGVAFYFLALGLALTAGHDLVFGHEPETTFWGVVVSLVSIATMWLLVRLKMNAGRELGSDAIVADARCTMTCLYLSFVLLAASAGYELTGIGRLDSLGALGIAVFAFREGREALEKARGKLCGCSEGCCD
jgi:hypothetical protein